MRGEEEKEKKNEAEEEGKKCRCSLTASPRPFFVTFLIQQYRHSCFIAVGQSGHLSVSLRKLLRGWAARFAGKSGMWPVEGRLACVELARWAAGLLSTAAIARPGHYWTVINIVA
ncbi:hypothetical protein E2C01_015950 [Portunus trituberculatus]|uniref:Uncharacterized protein n=1 Tax=Portunus trituberculatus TaxID=210409 RepID=A0A5B7DMU3_PORTR|nr:hypothetical protein [Portunus trituberculatus]